MTRALRLAAAACALGAGACGLLPTYEAKAGLAYPANQQPHLDGAVALIHNQVWVVSGATNGHPLSPAPTAEVDVYAPDEDVWFAGPQVNHARSGMPNAYAIGGELYLVGGLSQNRRAPVERITAPFRKWEVVPDSEPPFDLGLHRSGGVHGTLIVTLGATATETRAVVFDVVAGRWTARAAAPTVLGAFSSGAVLDGKLYVFDGMPKDEAAATAQRLHAYDIEADTWSDVAAVPVVERKWHYYGATAVMDGRVLSMGGALDGRVLYEFDPWAATVERTPDHLPFPVASFGIASREDLLVLAGGWDPGNRRRAVAPIAVTTP